MNPYMLLACALGVLAAVAGAGWKGYQMGAEHEIAQQAKADAIRRETRDAALEGAAEAISKIEVKNVTIRQRAETEVRERTVYRDCVSTADELRLNNEAITGQPSEPTGDRELPAVGAADGPELRSDALKAHRGRDSISEVPRGGPR